MSCSPTKEGHIQKTQAVARNAEEFIRLLGLARSKKASTPHDLKLQGEIEAIDHDLERLVERTRAIVHGAPMPEQEPDAE